MRKVFSGDESRVLATKVAFWQRNVLFGSEIRVLAKKSRVLATGSRLKPSEFKLLEGL